MPTKTPSRKVLYLDAGNSRIKAAVYRNGQWKTIGATPYGPDASGSILTDQIVSLCQGFDTMVLVSVKRGVSANELMKRTGGNVVNADRSVLASENHCYRSPETLGIDRFFACLGAWSLTNRQDVIVTDAGTACTIDVMNKDGMFLGGVIMPGLQMLIDSLGKGADGLFTVSREMPGSWPPASTSEAIQAGTAGTFLAAWKAHTRRTKILFPGAVLWLTGGDAGFLRDHSALPCRLSEYLVFEGLRFWFENVYR